MVRPKEPILRIGQVPGHLRHEGPVGRRREARNVSPSGLQIDEEENVVSGEPERRPHFCREEVHASYLAPMRAQEGSPRGGPIRCRAYTVVL